MDNACFQCATPTSNTLAVKAGETHVKRLCCHDCAKLLVKKFEELHTIFTALKENGVSDVQANMIMVAHMNGIGKA